ncbi:uncharacterized protein LOC125042788 [Penaeus chinensis]|uniref:uncharacterized protein LOC125042788 n=1 Tax=Penaeus chinensis TaxID=139456 RepID=UPI001FB78421|nr:uncharacterized protein LOC125042788 [Penaeus chinensis]
MVFKVLLVAAAVLCLGRAAPQRQQVLGVLQPQGSRDLGEYENIAAATIDVLPEIVKVFSKVAEARGKTNEPQTIQRLMLDFMPVTRKVIEATEKAEGRKIPKDTYHRFNAAERVMPHVVTFMDQFMNMDFFGLSTTTRRPTQRL